MLVKSSITEAIRVTIYQWDDVKPLRPGKPQTRFKNVTFTAQNSFFLIN